MFPLPSALAHVPIEGWGDFANGAVHPLVSPAQLLAIAGLALLTGYIILASSNAAGKPIAMNAVRVHGSWIVAISLLMLAFEMRGSG